MARGTHWDAGPAVTMSVTHKDLYEHGKFSWDLWNGYLETIAHPSLEVMYRFMVDEGDSTATYRTYLNSGIRARIRDSKNYKTLAWGRNIICVSRKSLKKDVKRREQVRAIEDDLQCGGIRYFAPNGAEAARFLADRSNSVKMLCGPTRSGKSYTGIVEDLLDITPTGWDWPIHKDYGVPYREWTGPKILILSSYTLDLLETGLWPLLKSLLTARELGMYIRRGRGARKVTWDRNPVIKLGCGSEIRFRSYTQGLEAFTSIRAHKTHTDEQGIEALWDGANERASTFGHTPMHIFSLTPHVLPGRPDTGAGSWIHKLWDGHSTKGHSVGKYQLSIHDPPDWHYPEKSKWQKLMQWVIEPEMRGDNRTLREGRAMVYGEWHKGSGLVYEEFMTEYHVIEPFTIPPHWTLYRWMDHADRNATVCLFAAVSEMNEIYLWQEYYQKNRLIAEHVPAILEMSGNIRVQVGKYMDSRSGVEFKMWEERMTGHVFEKTVIDPNSFSSPDKSSTRTIGKLYRMEGLHVQPSPGYKSPVRVPWVKGWLAIDYANPHPYNKDKAGNPLEGRPKFYVFNSCRHFIFEITHRAWKRMNPRSPDDTPTETPEKKHDDTQNSFEYGIMSNPKYLNQASSRAKPTGPMRHNIEESDDEDNAVAAGKPRPRSRRKGQRPRPTCVSTGY